MFTRAVSRAILLFYLFNGISYCSSDIRKSPVAKAAAILPADPQLRIRQWLEIDMQTLKIRISTSVFDDRYDPFKREWGMGTSWSLMDSFVRVSLEKQVDTAHTMQEKKFQWDSCENFIRLFGERETKRLDSIRKVNEAVEAKRRLLAPYLEPYKENAPRK